MTASLASGDNFLKSSVFLRENDTWGSSWGIRPSWRGTGRLRVHVTTSAKIAERRSLIATTVLTNLPAGRDEWVSYCLRPWRCVVTGSRSAIALPTRSLSRPVCQSTWDVKRSTHNYQLLERVWSHVWLIKRMKDFHINNDEIFRSVPKVIIL